MTAAEPPRVLPGFGPAISLTVAYLSLLILIPLSTLVLKTASMGPEAFWAAVTSPRTLAAYRLSFGAALAAAAINAVFGLVVAWVLERYRIPRQAPRRRPGRPAVRAADRGRRHRADDAVRRERLDRQQLAPLGIKVAYTPLGVVVALTFIGLPFVVRTVQPVLAGPRARDRGGGGRARGRERLRRSCASCSPACCPRWPPASRSRSPAASGEYGSVVFIAGNMPMDSEITPLLIMIKLEQYDYAGATAIALVFLVASFAMLLVVNALARRGAARLRVR